MPAIPWNEERILLAKNLVRKRWRLSSIALRLGGVTPAEIVSCLHHNGMRITTCRMPKGEHGRCGEIAEGGSVYCPSCKQQVESVVCHRRDRLEILCDYDDRIWPRTGPEVVQ